MAQMTMANDSLTKDEYWMELSHVTRKTAVKLQFVRDLVELLLEVQLSN